MTAPNTDRPVRALVADDVRASREILRTWLLELGIEPTLAEDGQQAWESFQNNVFDFLITDIEMPLMTGLELLTRVRKHASDELRATPVIVVTSLLDREIGNVVREFGGTTVIMKPLSKRLTQHVIQNVLDGVEVPVVNENSETTDGASGGATFSPTFRKLVRKAKS